VVGLIGQGGMVEVDTNIDYRLDLTS